MGELHGEWKEIPCAEVANLVSKEPRALVKDTGFRIEGSVRKREEGCEAVEIRRGIAPGRHRGYGECVKKRTEILAC